MGSSIDTQSQAYYKKQYAEAKPDTQNKVTYTIQKGDNLWSIAREKLNKKDVKNSEIQDMMYQIAKLNSFDTLEKANNLEINNVIYLPSSSDSQSAVHSGSDTKKVRDSKTTAAEINKILEPEGLNYFGTMRYKQKHIDSVPVELYTENGKAGINYWADMLNKDSKLFFQKSYSSSPTKPSGLVITKKENDFPYGKTEAYLLVQVDDNGKFKEVAFNTPDVKMHRIQFDYELDSNGNLKRPSNAYGGMEVLDKMKKEEYQQFVQALQKYVDEQIN